MEKLKFIHNGSFVDLKGGVYEVVIQTLPTELPSNVAYMDIGQNPIHFAASPLEFKSDSESLNDVILSTSATIRLQTSTFLPHLFAASCFDVGVEVRKDSHTIYKGYISPQTYSQGYTDIWEDLELNCIDALASLQYKNYLDIKEKKSYDEAKQLATTQTFKDIIVNSLKSVLRDCNIYYDNSKRLTKESDKNIFDELSISELLFFGADETDVWSLQDVVKEILKYLNLHILQKGLNFYIYDIDSLTRPTTSWTNLIDNSTKETEQKHLPITINNTMGADTNVSIGDVYSRLSLKCSPDKIDTVIPSPLDKNDLTSPFSRPQLVCREYSCLGAGERAAEAFYNMINGRIVQNFKSCKITDWYLKAMYHPQWDFFYRNFRRYTDSKQDNSTVYDALIKEGKNQHLVSEYIGNSNINYFGAALIRLGSIEKKIDGKDDTIKNNLSLNDYLVIGVNGDGTKTPSSAMPNDYYIKKNIPLAEYKGSSSIVSPSDDSTNNYLIIKGKMLLMPNQKTSKDFKVKNTFEWEDFWGARYGNVLIPTKDGKNRIYMRRYFSAEDPKDTPQARDLNLFCGDFVPPSEDRVPQLKYNYSTQGDETDKIKKLAVLSCMLIVGDKCVVESGPEGDINDFKWVSYKSLEKCKDEEEYYAQSFTIGINPKIGDEIIGKDYSIQNNIPYGIGLEGEGTAIRIRKEDKVSGNVQFKILGVVNSVWNDVIRRHPTLFRHTKYYDNDVSVLSLISAIYLQDFEIKVANDNGGNDIDKEKDIIYYSDKQTDFLNEKDDIEFKICSGLTSDECKKMQIKNFISLANPLSTKDKTPITQIYNQLTDTADKPEVLYLQQYYKHYSTPHIEVDHTLLYEFIDNPCVSYALPGLPNRVFCPIGRECSVSESEERIKMREIK